MKDTKEILDTLEAVRKTSSEVIEMLQKSTMYKADMPPPPPMPTEDHQEPDADNMGGPSDGDADNMGGEQAGEMGAEGGQEDQEAAFIQMIAEMPDEELEHMLEALANELEKRQGGQEGGEQPPMGDQPPPPPVAPEMPSPEMEAMKSENAMMRKSLQSLNGKIEALEKSMKKPVSKPAANNKPATVLEKSVKDVELLNKSEVMSYLETMQKSNKNINSDLIWYANRVQSNDEMKGFYEMAKVKGINIPTK